MVSWPNTNKVSEALEKIEFLVVMDPFWTATAEKAHIVLPACTFMERIAMCGIYEGMSTPMVQFRRQVIPPLHESRSDCSFWLALARKMGGEYDEYIPWNSDEEAMDYWLSPSGLEKRWTAIVIHHSGTENGNSAIFDKWHRERNKWDGVGYEFVIGNGTDSRDGQVEVTYRWRKQLTGAHCKTPQNWANEDAVGICLVGDFNITAPTTRQIQSLLKLTRFLQKRYGIDQSRVFGHNTTPGAHVTDCPGQLFPMSRLKSSLGY